ALLTAGAGYWLGTRHASSERAAPTATTPTATSPAIRTNAANAATERKVLYWHDPMVPGTRFDKPGKSPYMDMQLVPVYADVAGSDAGVAVSARQVQNFGVRTAVATEGSLENAFTAVGAV